MSGNKEQQTALLKLSEDVGGEVAWSPGFQIYRLHILDADCLVRYSVIHKTFTLHHKHEGEVTELHCMEDLTHQLILQIAHLKHKKLEKGIHKLKETNLNEFQLDWMLD